MKKFLILVSCFAVVLILSKVSFAQEEVVAEPAAPCACCYCTTSALPFAYPPYPAQRGFGNKFAARRSLPPQVLPQVEPVAFPYPYGVSDLKPLAVRRAARLAPQPQPYPVAVPVPAALPGPPAPVAPLAYAPAPSSMNTHGPVGQTGQKNALFQRSGAPMSINFLSLVRAPRDPYAGYSFYPAPVQPQLP